MSEDNSGTNERDSGMISHCKDLACQFGCFRAQQLAEIFFHRAREKDMRGNPYQRRGARAQEPAQVEIEVGGVKVRQGAKTEKTDRKIPAAQKGRGRMVDEGVEEDQITVHLTHSPAKAHGIRR